MSAPASTKGRIRNILEALYTWVDAALDADYSSYYTTMNYRFGVQNTTAFPLVTIRVDPATLMDVTYGRRMPSAGSVVEYQFTLHVFEKYNTASGENYNRDAHICARRIVDYLENRDRDLSGSLAAYGIWKIRDIGLRESDPNLRNVARIIISGTIDVVREDSP